MTLHAEEYNDEDFWDKIAPSDSISIHTKLFIPSSENNNEMNLVLKFHIISPNYTFSI